ncbi:MAG: TrmB family transcriptional regulator, partial [Deltaproteobacteria bacterium]|nr:TrmB family transcriptional regulator [Deltaproteobacteria bacterium]
MEDLDKLKELGFSQYEVSCYLTLLKNHPINGSQLSKFSGVARSRVYDVLRNLTRKGIVQEIEDSLYVPLPADELLKRLQTQFEGNINVLKEQLNDISKGSSFEYIWTLTGYQSVLDRAIEMIKNASTELYIRIFPKAAKILDPFLHEAVNRGVGIRYIAMGDTSLTFDIQVIHPKSEKLIY